MNSNLDHALHKIISVLEDEKFDYLIIGGLATSILGEARVTHDIDILISLHEKNVENFLKTIQKKGFQCNISNINRSIETRGVFQIFYNIIHLDFIIGRMPFEQEAFKRKQRIKLFNRLASFPTKEDLIYPYLIYPY